MRIKDQRNELNDDACWEQLVQTPVDTEVRRAVFLDRDGVLIVDKHYLHSPDRVELCPGAAWLVSALGELNFLRIIVTNQSGIGRGIFTWRQFEQVNLRMFELFEAQNATFDLVLASPFHPEALPPYARDHWSRKPNPGMLFRAQKLLSIDMARSAIIGDKLSDLQAGQRAGIPVGVFIGPESKRLSIAQMRVLRVESLAGSHDQCLAHIVG